MLKEYLEWVDGNIEWYYEEYNEIVRNLNNILSLFEKYFPASKNFKCFYQNCWVKNSFLINEKSEDLFIINIDKCIEMTTDLPIKSVLDKIS